MKTLILTLGALTTFSLVNAQDIAQAQVPSVILNAFTSQFADATDVEWEMSGTLYNVDFEIGWGVDHEVWFDAEGQVVKHKEEISRKELPEAVVNRIKTDFDGLTIDDLKRITNRGEVVYEMELNALTKQDWNVVIDATGKVVSKMAD